MDDCGGDGDQDASQGAHQTTETTHFDLEYILG